MTGASRLQRSIAAALVLVPLLASGAAAFLLSPASLTTRSAGARHSATHTPLRGGSIFNHTPLRGGGSSPSSSIPTTQMNMFKNLMGGGGRAAPLGGSRPVVSLFGGTSAVPAWDVLVKQAEDTETGKRILAERALREQGEGPTHTDNKLRLFGAKEEDVRVVLYRDAAAWCPYCQKVWLLLEEKRIPYRIEKINMRSYGEKPEWFLKKVPNGLLPAVEVDGKMMTESIVIMQVLDDAFPTDNMMVPADQEQRQLASKLMNLERELFGAWCSFCFRPGLRAQPLFESTLTRVDEALRATPGPWFLGGDYPTIVDMQYVSHIERMLPSCLYWKGLRIRGSGRWPGIDAWFAEFEKRPTYLATKGDFYTHVTDIPPQYGPGQMVPAGEVFAPKIDGREGWTLPLPEASETDIEPVLPSWNPGNKAAAEEAALMLAQRHEIVSRFACRAMGADVGTWRREGGAMRSSLADPNAQSDLRFEKDTDVCLQHVVYSLLHGHTAAIHELKRSLAHGEGGEGAGASRGAVVAALEYLRQRVGVPRDMSYPAARQLRAHITAVLEALNA